MMTRNDAQRLLAEIEREIGDATDEQLNDEEWLQSIDDRQWHVHCLLVRIQNAEHMAHEVLMPHYREGRV